MQPNGRPSKGRCTSCRLELKSILPNSPWSAKCALQIFHDCLGHLNATSTAKMVAERYLRPHMSANVYQYFRYATFVSAWNESCHRSLAWQATDEPLWGVLERLRRIDQELQPRDGAIHPGFCRAFHWLADCEGYSRVIDWSCDGLHKRRVHCTVWISETTVSDNASCFTSKAMKSFMGSNSIKWKTVLAYIPMSNSRPEQMVGTLKKSVERLVTCD